MTTLYIRDVPDSVAAVLKERAAAEGMSLSTYVGAQLATLAARPTNEQIVARLHSRSRSHGPRTEEVLDSIAAGRR
ncbi:MAG: antitoxin [Dermatophilaceae bacterium]